MDVHIQIEREGRYHKYFALGVGLHTIQDFYAHNVMLNQKRERAKKGNTRITKLKL